jgi:hypothetical protein
MTRAERAMVFAMKTTMALKRVMVSNNNNDHNNNNDSDNNDDKDNSSNKDDNTDNYNNNKDGGNANLDKDIVAETAGGFVGDGGVSSGNGGGVGGDSFGGWRVVVVVELAVAEGGEGACSRRKPSAWCLKRLMGSWAMANDAMDVSTYWAKLVGGRAAAALLVFVLVHCVCGWVPRVQKILSA